jgi:hypothetical protein
LTGIAYAGFVPIASILKGKVIAMGEIDKNITSVFTPTGSGTEISITAVTTGTITYMARTYE